MQQEKWASLISPEGGVRRGQLIDDSFLDDADNPQAPRDRKRLVSLGLSMHIIMS
jgi:hypothetical protein